MFRPQASLLGLWLSLVALVALTLAAPLPSSPRPREGTATATAAPPAYHLTRILRSTQIEQPTSSAGHLVFCDFFNQDALSRGGSDGLDDLATTGTFYSVATEAVVPSRDIPPADRRPVTLLEGGRGQVHCLTGRNPFPSMEDTPRMLDSVLTGVHAVRGLYYSSAEQDILVAGRDAIKSYQISLPTPPVVVSGRYFGRSVSMLLYASDTSLSLRPLASSEVPRWSISRESFSDIAALAATDLDDNQAVDAVVAGRVTSTPHEHSLLWAWDLGADNADPLISKLAVFWHLGPGVRAGQLLVGDFDGDGRASDVVVVSGPGSMASPRLVYFLSSGGFRHPVTVDLAAMLPAGSVTDWTTVSPRAAVVRLTGGGPAHDVVVALGPRVYVLHGPRAPPGPGSPSDGSSGDSAGSDTTGDGLLLTLADVLHSPLVPDLPAGHFLDVAFGDFDGDNLPDLALTRSDAPMDILLLTQVAATRRRLCGRKSMPIILPAGNFWNELACQCVDLNADPGHPFAPCEFCKPRFFLSPEGTCQPCHADCDLCEGPGPGDCRTCAVAGHAPSNGTCAARAPVQVGLTAQPTAPFVQVSPPVPFDGGIDDLFTMSRDQVLSVSASAAEMAKVRDVRLAGLGPAGAEPRRAGQLLVTSRGTSKWILEVLEQPAGGQMRIQTTSLPLDVDITLAMRRFPAAEAGGNPTRFAHMGSSQTFMCPGGPAGDTCEEFATKHSLPSSVYATPGRVHPPGATGILRPVLPVNEAALGKRRLYTSAAGPSHSIWHPVDNVHNVDRLLVLSAPPASTYCSVSYSAALSHEVNSASAPPLAIMHPEADQFPCGPMISLPAGPGVRPPVLVVSDSSHNAHLLYLLRNPTLEGEAPRFEKAIPLLVPADLGYLPNAHPRLSWHFLQQTARPSRVELVLWDGLAAWIVTVHHPAGPEAPRVELEPLVASQALTARTTDSLSIASLEVALRPGPEAASSPGGATPTELVLVLRDHSSKKLYVFRRATKASGCGCGDHGVCTPPAGGWGFAPCAPGTNGCLPVATSLRPEDFCTCRPEAATVDPQHPCRECASAPGAGGLLSPGADGPAAVAATCSLCSVAQCAQCTVAGGCLACHTGWLLDPAGNCVQRCDSPTAVVQDGRCRSSADGSRDTWRPWPRVVAGPGWEGFQVEALLPVRPARARYSSGRFDTPLATVHASLVGRFAGASAATTRTFVPASQELPPLGKPTLAEQVNLSRALVDTCSPNGKNPGLEPDLLPLNTVADLRGPAVGPWFGALYGDAPAGPGPDDRAAQDPTRATGLGLVHAAAVSTWRLTTAPQANPSSLCHPDDTAVGPTLVSLDQALASSNLLRPSSNTEGYMHHVFAECRAVGLPFAPEEVALVEPGSQPLDGQHPQNVVLARRLAAPDGSRPARLLVVLPQSLVGRGTSKAPLGACRQDLLIQLPDDRPRYSELTATGGVEGSSSISYHMALTMPQVADVFPQAPVSGPAVLLSYFVNFPSSDTNLLGLLVQPPGDVPLHQALVYQQSSVSPVMLVLARADGQAAGLVMQELACLQQQSVTNAWALAGQADGPPFSQPGSLTAGDFLPGNRSGRRDMGCPLVVLEHEPIASTSVLHRFDIDGDGRLDMVLVDEATGRLVFYLAVGSAVAGRSFRRSEVTIAGLGAPLAAGLRRRMLLADLDGDRFVEVVLVVQADGSSAGGSALAGASALPSPLVEVYSTGGNADARCPSPATFNESTLECQCPAGGLRVFDPQAWACVCPEGFIPEGDSCKPGCPPGRVELPAAAGAAAAAAAAEPGAVCLDACPDGWFEPATGNICQACSEACPTCYGPGPDQCGSGPSDSGPGSGSSSLPLSGSNGSGSHPPAKKSHTLAIALGVAIPLVVLLIIAGVLLFLAITKRGFFRDGGAAGSKVEMGAF
ncbi:hypothetical protein H696_03265 [Fonticula alba]|uniref:EGF-like domain-containing protein n=1 Tax=Fonticula alba TaxID=691883 RepID=A0A058Z690_FONAL|nr:hypothetical protein H696_03265 [Fonticula alba]KCV69809.1 hypothetical protein H696_03265 [Fonticula alba]|eukprot:XP_009495415.1 hypothetical protein H696_03265 [Fonticula alba]